MLENQIKKYEVESQDVEKYFDAKRITRDMRALSIGMTTLSGYQLGLFMTGNIPTATNIGISFLCGVAGFRIGQSLENYYKSSSIGVAKYAYKEMDKNGNPVEWKQTFAKKRAEGFSGGNRSAYWLNFFTFSVGIYATYMTYTDIRHAFSKDAIINKSILKTIKNDNKILDMKSERLEFLYISMNSNDSSKVADQIRLATEDDINRVKKEIKYKYKIKIDRAIEAQEKTLNEINKWEKSERKKHSNIINKFKFLNRKLKEKKSAALQPLTILEREYKDELLNIKVAKVSPVQAKKAYEMSVKNETKELEGEISTLNSKIKSDTAEMSSSDGSVDWGTKAMVLIIGMLTAFGFYNAMERILKNLESLEEIMEREISAAKNLKEYASSGLDRSLANFSFGDIDDKDIEVTPKKPKKEPYEAIKEDIDREMVGDNRQKHYETLLSISREIGKINSDGYLVKVPVSKLEKRMYPREHKIGLDYGIESGKIEVMKDGSYIFCEETIELEVA